MIAGHRVLMCRVHSGSREGWMTTQSGDVCHGQHQQSGSRQFVVVDVNFASSFDHISSLLNSGRVIAETSVPVAPSGEIRSIRAILRRCSEQYTSLFA